MSRILMLRGRVKTFVALDLLPLKRKRTKNVDSFLYLIIKLQGRLGADFLRFVKKRIVRS